MRSPTLKSSMMFAVRAHGYGPFSYARAATVGFLLGSLAYMFTAYGSYTAGTMIGPSQVAVLLKYAAVAALVMLLRAMLGNFIIGRRIRDDRGQ